MNVFRNVCKCNSLYENCLFWILISLKFVPNDTFNSNTSWTGDSTLRNCRVFLFKFHWYLFPRMHLTHWGRVTHICVSKQTIIGSDNGLSPGRRQAIIWTNAGMLLIGTLGTNFSQILIEIRIFSFKKIGLKVSSAKWRPFCLGLNVLTRIHACST